MHYQLKVEILVNKAVTVQAAARTRGMELKCKLSGIYGADYWFISNK